MTSFEAARQVLRVLRSAGEEAYLVGGCVRDHLLGAAPETLTEFDIATSAAPDLVERLFPRTIPVGRAFGVMMVGIGRVWLEVATYRTEADYQNGRHPSSVAFADARQDVLRRDFTVNGLLWDPETGRIEDYVGGLPDLKERLVRAIGNPDERFEEDALRLLRAVRFGSFGDFSLEPGTLAAVRRHGGRIRQVSAERVRDELEKIATRPGSRRGDAWRLLLHTGLAALLLPEGTRSGDAEGEAKARVLDALQRRSLPLFLAVVLRDACPPGTWPRAWYKLGERVGSSLRTSTLEARRLADLLAGRACYRRLGGLSKARLRLAATRADREDHEDLLGAEGDAEEVLALLAQNRSERGEQREEPLIDGNVLRRRGMPAGPTMGRALRRVRVLQLRGALGSQDEALRYLGL